MRYRVLVGLLGMLLAAAGPALAQGSAKDPPPAAGGGGGGAGLRGEQRSQFISGSIDSCMPGFLSSSRGQFTDRQARVYCECVSEYMADAFTLEDVVEAGRMGQRGEQPTGRIMEIIMAGARRCVPLAQEAR